ncbi:MAG TPA: hypothetical protein VM182_16340 [Terriglobia bacterium]|nr:hypothetical protein [Terriglobia bacterium]
MLKNFRPKHQLVWLLLAFLWLLPHGLLAEEHVVSSAELRKELVGATEDRRNNLKQVRDFFSSAPVREAMKNLPADTKKVEQAAASLSDEELARLAQRTQRNQEDFAAGALSTEHLTYIVIALAAAVLVLVLK